MQTNFNLGEYSMAIYKREFVFSGDDVTIYDFPEKTRIIYPPEAFPADDERAAIINALDRPVGTLPLISQVNPSSKVTIAFDDPCIPIPPMTNDTRKQIIEAVVEKLFAAGVKKENIKLICAGGIHRKWTLKELSTILGKKITREFKKNISCHDAEDPDSIAILEKTTEGEDVEINRALLDSDLVIYANVNFVTMNGGWKSAAVGLSTYNSIRHHHSHETLKIGSLIDPESSAMLSSISRMGEVIKKHTNYFMIETVLNNNVWPKPIAKHLTPIGKNKKRKPSALINASLPIAQITPDIVKKQIRNSLSAGYRMIGVNAGNVDEVHKKTLELLFQQQNTSVTGQSDIVIYGVPNFCPYAALSNINPMLVITMAMGYYFNFYRGKPLVKKDGVIIIANPLTEQFHMKHHPSYYDFYNKYLPEYKNPEDVPKELEKKYATDPSFINLYRHEYAYHGAHALMGWYWASKGLNYPQKIIAAGVRDNAVAEKLGLLPAKDLTEAIAIAEEIMGKDASLTYHFLTPMSAVDVK
jgi:lactate racemase-like protein